MLHLHDEERPMTKIACFSRKTLREYLLGDLPEAALDQVAQHVEECVDCEATVAVLGTA